MKRLKYLILPFLFISCGLEQKNSSDDETVDIGELMNISSTLNTNQENIARNICNALRSKRLKFSNSIWPSRLEFEVKNQTCHTEYPSSIVYSRVAKSSSIGYTFIPNGVSTGTIRESMVQTDDEGHLRTVCDAIFNDNDIGIVNFESSSLVRVISFADNNKFIISTGIKSGANNEYFLNEKVEYSVNLSSSSNQYGYVQKRRVEQQCSGFDNDIKSSIYERNIYRISF